jgi:hypothetical protein
MISPPAATYERQPLAQILLRVYTAILQSKRLLMTRSVRRASRLVGEPRGRSLLEVERLAREIERFQSLRDECALHCPPSEPQYWITAYSRLLGLSDELIGTMEASLPTMSESTRREVLTADLPLLKEGRRDFQNQLRSKQLALMRSQRDQRQA